MKRLILAAILLCSPLGVVAETQVTDSGPVNVTKMIDGLITPWGMTFVSDDALLITERDGRLIYAEDGKTNRVKGVPKVWAQGQGGLLDVVAARDFAQSREIFLSYSEPRRGGAATALAVAQFNKERMRLENLRVLFRMNGTSRAGQHFGSRIVEARDGSLYLTIGDRGARPLAQDISVHNGKVIRVNRDGSIPAENPLARGPAPEIWSYGHRNPQGAALDRNGRLWTVEHGPRGGDEINQPQPGKNYGWPVISYGTHYSGARVGEGTAKTGMVQPALYWDPSIAPSGMMIYKGSMFPQWRDNIFVGSLKFDMISRSVVSGETAREVERLFPGKYGRIRDIREAPDGSIWFMSVGDDAVYRMAR